MGKILANLGAIAGHKMHSELAAAMTQLERDSHDRALLEEEIAALRKQLEEAQELGSKNAATAVHTQQQQPLLSSATTMSSDASQLYLKNVLFAYMTAGPKVRASSPLL